MVVTTQDPSVPQRSLVQASSSVQSPSVSQGMHPSTGENSQTLCAVQTSSVQGLPSLQSPPVAQGMQPSMPS
jgi:hypothetical protein